MSGRFFVGGQSGGHPRPGDRNVQVGGGRDLHGSYTLDRTDFSADGFSNPQRGSTKWLGEWENWNGKIAKLDFRRLLKHNLGQNRVRVAAAQELRNALD